MTDLFRCPTCERPLKSVVLRQAKGNFCDGKCPLPPAPSADLVVERMIIDVSRLTDDQRRELFARFCAHCGSNNPSCQCWNDE